MVAGVVPFGSSRRVDAWRERGNRGQLVAHALLMSIWHVMAAGTPYDELGEDYFTTRIDPGCETRRLVARLRALGRAVTLVSAAA